MTYLSTADGGIFRIINDVSTVVTRNRIFTTPGLRSTAQDFTGKSLIRVRKDGVRIYYNEKRVIHRDPLRGPAIENPDGTGQCFVEGSPTGEVYEATTANPEDLIKAEEEFLKFRSEDKRKDIQKQAAYLTDLLGKPPTAKTVMSFVSPDATTKGSSSNGGGRLFVKGKTMITVRRGKKIALVPQVIESHFTVVPAPGNGCVEMSGTTAAAAASANAKSQAFDLRTKEMTESEARMEALRIKLLEKFREHPSNSVSPPNKGNDAAGRA